MWSVHLIVFFFKQKTAYELRMSDWSSDVCASDLLLACLVMALGYRARRRLADAERAIRDRGQRFRDVAETAAGWIWETDAELRFTYLSDRVEQAAGVDKSVLDRKSTRLNSSH